MDSEWGWKEFCEETEFLTDSPQESFTFTLATDAKILVIDSQADLHQLDWIDDTRIDWDLVAEKWDAIHLTAKGEMRTRNSSPGLYGWDVETVLVLNPDVVETEENC